MNKMSNTMPEISVHIYLKDRAKRGGEPKKVGDAVKDVMKGIKERAKNAGNGHSKKKKK